MNFHGVYMQICVYKQIIGKEQEPYDEAMSHREAHVSVPLPCYCWLQLLLCSWYKLRILKVNAISIACHAHAWCNPQNECLLSILKSQNSPPRRDMHREEISLYQIRSNASHFACLWLSTSYSQLISHVRYACLPLISPTSSHTYNDGNFVNLVKARTQV